MHFTTRSARHEFWKGRDSAEAWLSCGCVAPIVIMFESLQEKGKVPRSAESAAELRMATKVPDPVDKHVGSRVRMRRLMLGMSQGGLADQLGLTFQQVQKYEKGTNRISASRLQEMCHILQVPVPFFFDGAPQTAGQSRRGGEAPSPAYVTDFLAAADGLKLVRAFTQISDAKLRRCVVRLVEEIGGEDDR